MCNSSSAYKAYLGRMWRLYKNNARRTLVQDLDIRDSALKSRRKRAFGLKAGRMCLARSGFRHYTYCVTAWQRRDRA